MSNESTPKLRLLPAVIVLALQWGVTYYFQYFGSTNDEVVIGNAAAPLLGTILLIIWWLASGQVSWRDRFVGLALFLAAVVAIVATHLPADKGAFLLMDALPLLTLGIVVILYITQTLGLPFWRPLVGVYMVVVVGVFALMRIVTLGGDLSVETAWIWEQRGGGAAAGAEASGTATLPATITAGDWPAFRGPNRDGVVPGVTFGTDWAATPPKEIWRQPIGAGHSSVTIVGDYGFTQEQVGENERITCFSAKTGETVWTNSIKTRHDDTLGGVGPRATPTFANGKIYAQSTAGKFQCLDASTGKAIWTQELTTPESPKPPEYGFASSPLVVGNMVLQYASGAGRNDLAAFKADTGEEIWSAAKGTGGYSSPHLAEIAGVKQVLLWNSVGLQSIDPANGALIWEHEFRKKQYPRCVQPLLAGEGRIALGANMDFGTRLVTASNAGGAWEAKETWTNAKHQPYFNDNVGLKGAIYGFNGNRLCCIDLATGETKWQGKRCGGQVIALPDLDLILALTEKGEVLLVKAESSAYTEVASFKALTGKTWNHPVIANGHLFVRNSEEMACFKL